MKEGTQAPEVWWGPPSQGTQASGTGTLPPWGTPASGGVSVSLPLPPGPPAHLLHEDFVALVDAALPQLPLGEPQRPAALGGSAGPGRHRRGQVRPGDTRTPKSHPPTLPRASPPPRRRRQLQRPLEAPPPNRRRRRHLAGSRTARGVTWDSHVRGGGSPTQSSLPHSGPTGTP